METVTNLNIAISEQKFKQLPPGFFHKQTENRSNLDAHFMFIKVLRSDRHLYRKGNFCPCSFEYVSDTDCLCIVALTLSIISFCKFVFDACTSTCVVFVQKPIYKIIE